MTDCAPNEALMAPGYPWEGDTSIHPAQRLIQLLARVEAGIKALEGMQVQIDECKKRLDDMATWQADEFAPIMADVRKMIESQRPMIVKP